MGVPGSSTAWERPLLRTGLLPGMLGYSLKMLGLEVPVAVVLRSALTYMASNAMELKLDLQDAGGWLGLPSGEVFQLVFPLLLVLLLALFRSSNWLIVDLTGA
jgi:hypothetical protein